MIKLSESEGDHPGFRLINSKRKNLISKTFIGIIRLSSGIFKDRQWRDSPSRFSESNFSERLGTQCV